MTLRQENKGLYWAWKSMKQRCQNPRCYAYHNYGERGIAVCDEWQNFEPFCDWALNNGYEKGLDLDRIDNNLGYDPSNCRWTSRRDNVNNRRKTTMLTINGITKPRTEWEELAGISPGTVKAWTITHNKEYAERRIEDALEHGYTPRDYGYSHRKTIINLDTNKIYGSTKEAAEDVGLAPCTISNSIRNGRTTSKGRFQYEETINNYGNEDL